MEVEKEEKEKIVEEISTENETLKEIDYLLQCASVECGW